MSTRRPIHSVKAGARVAAWLCAFVLAPAFASGAGAQETIRTPAAQGKQAVESSEQPGRNLRSQSKGVRGVVVDENGSPVEGAFVGMAARSVDVTLAKTDAEGYFDFGVAQPYDFSLTVQAEGFGRFVRRWEEGEWKGEALRVVLAPPSLSEQVTVTASRAETRLGETAASVVVLSSEELESTAALTPDDALRQVPGFQLFRRTGSRAANPTAQGVSLRGVGASGASRAVVLYDGVPLNDPFGGWVYWTRVPREAVGRVEVVRGGASSLYGSAALGGVVQFVPRERPGVRELRLELSYGSQGTPDVSLYAAERRGRWLFNVAAQDFATDGYVLVDERVRGPVDTNAASRGATGELYVERQFGRGLSLSARASSYGESRRNGTPLQFNRTHIRQLAAGGSWGPGGGRGLFTFRAYASTQVLDQSFTAVSVDRRTETLTRLQRVPAQGSGLSFQWSGSAGGGVGRSHSLVAGFESGEARGASDETVYASGRATSLVGAGGRARTSSLFARDLITITPRFTLAPSARVDLWRNFAAQQTTRALTGAPSVISFPDREESAFSPQLSALFKVNERVSLTSTFARAFRAPTLNELYRSFRVGNVLTLADENLRAERLTSGEAGLIYEPRRGVSLRATAFWTDVTRAVANVTLSATPALITRRRRNLGRTRSRGFEAEGEVRAGGRWTLSAGYLFADARVASFPADASLEGLRVPQVAPHQLTFQARYTKPTRLNFGVQARASSSQFDDDQNVLRLRGYFTLDALVSRCLARGVEAFAAAENLTGRRYEVGRTPVLTLGPPLFVRVGLRFRLGERGRQ
ncbi:MAG TPA: TonB-dependent receptor [Pyrinomonadaceae bacterium]|nr:TonB-dependent receptor [Pyrinomonadaceae bacterium]